MIMRNITKLGYVMRGKDGLSGHSFILPKRTIIHENVPLKFRVASLQKTCYPKKIKAMLVLLFTC